MANRRRIILDLDDWSVCVQLVLEDLDAGELQHLRVLPFPHELPAPLVDELAAICERIQPRHTQLRWR